MSQTDLEKQTEEARKVHLRIPETLKSSPIILRKPAENIYHQLQFRQQTEKELETQAGLREYLRIKNDEGSYNIGEAAMVAAARDFVYFQIPYLENTPERILEELDNRREWGRRGHFGLLKESIMHGIVPSDDFDFSGTEPISFQQAMIKAKEFGYNIPEKYLAATKIREDKKNAYYAAIDLKHGEIRFCDTEKSWRRITSVTSGFLVPDPDEHWKIPFVLDQLWVIQETNARVRFLAVIIDDQFSQIPENLEKAKIRDEKLTRQGFEVYHVAGWWCLVDPWRAMAEVISQAGIYSGAANQFGADEMATINDYICERCEQPMIRFDEYWIEAKRGYYDEENDWRCYSRARYYHSDCLEEEYDY